MTNQFAWRALSALSFSLLVACAGADPTAASEPDSTPSPTTSAAPAQGDSGKKSPTSSSATTFAAPLPSEDSGTGTGESEDAGSPVVTADPPVVAPPVVTPPVVAPPVVTPPVVAPPVVAPPVVTPPVVTPPVVAPPVVTPPVVVAPASLRGANLVGMEGNYTTFSQSVGPIPNTNYPVYSTAVVDYLASKHVNVLRFLFSWERMQSTLNGPVPAATTGNYKSYFDDYKRIVDYATNTKGMTVIIEPWQASATGGVGGAAWRGNIVGGGVVTGANFGDFWGKMAAVYAGNPRVNIGLVNEPNGISTMVWFDAAQSAITAIRGAGFTGEIHIPGNGWTNGSGWNDSWYDTASPQRSNAYGWMNARGTGKPLSDPLNKLVASVHSYANTDASGSATDVVSGTVTRERLTGVVDWARANKLTVFIGEIGMYAPATNAKSNWTDFVSYLDANRDILRGFAWWGCGAPGWWDDVAASGGGHFSITPTGNYTTDTVNMAMISSAFTN